ncbi:hypothetical protein PMAYCL1PPCAC_08994 [Pristionchus mayeri]|uniref:Uncharacterized protein n=1 Tax=Pristionchus mayeri TaxID=1317129 RepID=A0AAN4ZF52_9BILA|nr:hypothetical protein PMAYCL1PPCAC_08994 [Pristionchus mayeri]
MCDNPNDDGILIDISDVNPIGMKLKCIHRGKAIFVSVKTKGLRRSVRKLGADIIVLEIDLHGRSFPEICARESSKFIFISQLNRMLLTVDIQTMVILPELKFR